MCNDQMNCRGKPVILNRTHDGGPSTGTGSKECLRKGVVEPEYRYFCEPYTTI